MSGNKQRRFTDEFKQEAVRLTMNSGRSVARVANDLAIAKSTLSRWRVEHEQADLLEGPHEDATLELARLRKENEILRQEREPSADRAHADATLATEQGPAARLERTATCSRLRRVGGLAAQ